MMAVALLAGSLIQFPLGWLSDKTDRRRVLAALTLGASIVGLALATLQPRSIMVILPMIGVFGMLIYPMWALAVAHANDFAENDSFVGLASGLLLLFGLGTAVGPVLGAALMDAWQPDALFAYTAATHVVIAAYAAWRISRRAAPQRSTFAGLPTTRGITPESAALDPRADPGSQKTEGM